MRQYTPIIVCAVRACIYAAAITAVIHTMVERDRKRDQHRSAAAYSQAFDAATRSSMRHR